MNWLIAPPPLIEDVRDVDRRSRKSGGLWDLKEHVEYLASRDLDTALRFVDAVELAYPRISENPDTGFLFGFESDRLKDVRVIIVPEFPNHLVFFRKQADKVRVLRVLHASRDITREFEG